MDIYRRNVHIEQIKQDDYPHVDQYKKDPINEERSKSFPDGSKNKFVCAMKFMSCTIVHNCKNKSINNYC